MNPDEGAQYSNVNTNTAQQTTAAKLGEPEQLLVSIISKIFVLPRVSRGSR